MHITGFTPLPRPAAKRPNGTQRTQAVQFAGQSAKVRFGGLEFNHLLLEGEAPPVQKTEPTATKAKATTSRSVDQLLSDMNDFLSQLTGPGLTITAESEKGALSEEILNTGFGSAFMREFDVDSVKQTRDFFHGLSQWGGGRRSVDDIEKEFADRDEAAKNKKVIPLSGFYSTGPYFSPLFRVLENNGKKFKVLYCESDMGRSCRPTGGMPRSQYNEALAVVSEDNQTEFYALNSLTFFRQGDSWLHYNGYSMTWGDPKDLEERFKAWQQGGTKGAFEFGGRKEESPEKAKAFMDVARKLYKAVKYAGIKN